MLLSIFCALLALLVPRTIPCGALSRAVCAVGIVRFASLTHSLALWACPTNALLLYDPDCAAAEQSSAARRPSLTHPRTLHSRLMASRRRRSCRFTFLPRSPSRVLSRNLLWGTLGIPDSSALCRVLPYEATPLSPCLSLLSSLSSVSVRLSSCPVRLHRPRLRVRSAPECHAASCRRGRLLTISLTLTGTDTRRTASFASTTSFYFLTHLCCVASSFADNHLLFVSAAIIRQDFSNPGRLARDGAPHHFSAAPAMPLEGRRGSSFCNRWACSQAHCPCSIVPRTQAPLSVLARPDPQSATPRADECLRRPVPSSQPTASTTT